MTNRPKRRSAFTLIEVLLVLVILGMLATVAIVGLRGTREGAKIDTTRALIGVVEGAMERYNLAIGHYPSEEEGGLKALWVKPTFTDEKLAEKWRDRFLEKEPIDAWGSPLNYELATGAGAEAGGKPYKLWSSGPDKQSGTDDDIKNWSEESGL